MKVIFMGTPEFAVPSLQALINSNHEIVAVVTQPDKEVGRNKKIQFSPIKQVALDNNLTLFQFNKIKNEGIDIINKLDADIIVTCAYGQILNEDILFAKKFGVINVHGSLLPKYRGASPIQSAIINGEKITGVTILKSDIGIDDGNMILKKELEIKENETYGELSIRLANLGAEALLEALNLIENGQAIYTPQDSGLATHCKMFKSGFGRLNFNNSARDIVNLIHGVNPSPIAYMIINDSRYKVYNAHILDNEEVLKLNLITEYTNGEVVLAKSKQGLIIKASDGFVAIDKIQAENGKILPVKDFLNGSKINVGDVAINE